TARWRRRRPGTALAGPLDGSAVSPGLLSRAALQRRVPGPTGGARQVDGDGEAVRGGGEQGQGAAAGGGQALQDGQAEAGALGGGGAGAPEPAGGPLQVLVRHAGAAVADLDA